MSECVNTRQSNRKSAHEQPIMARHQRMPTKEAGYTSAVEPTAIYQITCKRGGGGESIYGHSVKIKSIDPDPIDWENYSSNLPYYGNT